MYGNQAKSLLPRAAGLRTVWVLHSASGTEGVFKDKVGRYSAVERPDRLSRGPD